MAKEITKKRGLVKSLCRGELPADLFRPYPLLPEYEAFRIEAIEKEFSEIKHAGGDTLGYLRKNNLLGLSNPGSAGGLGLSRLGTIRILEILGYSGLFLAAVASQSGVGNSSSEGMPERIARREAEARLDWAAVCVGAARASLMRMTSYARGHFRDGRPLHEYQQIRSLIALSVIEVESARCMVETAAGMVDRKVETILESAVARFLAAQALEHAADAAIQLAGSEGLATGFDEQMLMDIRSARIFLGSDEILREMITEGGTQESLEWITSSRGGFLRTLLRRLGAYRSPSSLRPKELPVRLRPLGDKLSEMVLILGHIIQKLLRVYGESFAEEGNQRQRLAEMIIDVVASASVIAWAETILKDEKREAEEQEINLLLASEAVELAWERFVAHSGRLYTTKHDEELSAIGEFYARNLQWGKNR